ncbi:MAG: hypothetical protein ACXVP1_05335 [Thermoleophilia bacterium]
MAISEAYGLCGEGMLAEAHLIIDTARAQGVTLRLLGGLAVREHCRETAFCRRAYRDIDLVGLGSAAKRATAVLAGLGWDENRQVAMATMGRKRQFFRDCRHPAAGGRAHDDDRIDLYLDAFRLHHSIDLRRRLEFEPYTVSTSDVLLVKLQRTELNEDDLRDILTVLRDAAGISDDDAPGALNMRYIARLCAADWGLYHDVTRNIVRCRRALDAPAADGGAVTRRLDALEAALSAVPKGRRWRLRASVGERLAWHEPVDDVEGVYYAPGERP